MELKKAFAEIDLRALSHNLKEVKKRTGKRSIIAVVKANAYGHGLVEVSRHLVQEGVEMLGVAFTEEAIQLREAAIESPILVFFDRENIEAYLKYNLIPTVFDFTTAKRLSEEAYKHNLQLPIHIKVDTGMGRIGLDIKSAESMVLRIVRLKNIRAEGLMSHLSEADLADRYFTLHQIEKFRNLINSLRGKGVTFKYLHIANSAAVLKFPEAYFNTIRPGIMLYGYGCTENDNLKPVLSLKSNILYLKKVPAGTPISYGRTFITKRTSTVATLPVGYADGYNRRLSNCAEVLINGRRAPVVGRVCMDTVMVDVTDISDISIDSEVVLIGGSGKEKITAQDIAERIETIPYEVLTSIGQRVKRIYKKDV